MLEWQWLQPLGKGFLLTLFYFVWTLVISVPMGLGIAMLQHSLPNWVRMMIQGFVYVFRGTPLLLQIMFVYFGLPLLGIVLQREQAALVTLILNYTAYFIEIFRGGIQAVPPGQFEALKVLSINKWVGWRRVILPQVWCTVMPSIGNEVITLIKDTSLIYVLGLDDLLKVGKTLANQQASLLPYVYVSIIYLLFTGFVSVLLQKIEQKMGKAL
ncbi:amino acid ABC transporter permease [Tuanshanicoccus lijuaniae]|uniref:amino acid ABC transporter permease n=1 Tax=Aerococcaceae bacterium zg-1292 TaxID=2774330 RepID=UPI001BD89CC7|nr:amino acid ABC transporter permease [Aerococcaceae bacterium zg-BR22]MBS4456828.1 amino acid ABC transporter permease [Aerococcaceae bacterium zg-A91]MBS4458656.1 amino acid ABC transporter permease [Aerococcaceae bacterium zg-BR33]